MTLHLGHVPKKGETFESQGYVFEILDMDRHRLDKVLVMPARGGGDGQKCLSTFHRTRPV